MGCKFSVFRMSISRVPCTRAPGLFPDPALSTIRFAPLDSPEEDRNSRLDCQEEASAGLDTGGQGQTRMGQTALTWLGIRVPSGRSLPWPDSCPERLRPCGPCPSIDRSRIEGREARSEDEK